MPDPSDLAGRYLQHIEAAWRVLNHPTAHDAHGNGLVRCTAVADALSGAQDPHRCPTCGRYHPYHPCDGPIEENQA